MYQYWLFLNNYNYSKTENNNTTTKYYMAVSQVHLCVVPIHYEISKKQNTSGIY